MALTHHQSFDLPQILPELKNYIFSLFGEKLGILYFQKIITPMEEYTLHIASQYELIDDIVDKLCKNGFVAKIHPSFENLIVCRPNGPFNVQLHDAKKEIVVDKRASEMIYQGSDVFIPGVKRANKVKKGDIVKITSQRGITVAKAEANLSHNEMLQKKVGIAAKNLQSPYQVPSLSTLGASEHFPIFFQTFPAYLASLNLEPQPDDKILDCCAAPGNKTLHLSELTKNKAQIVAVDRSKNRLQKLAQRVSKFHLNNIKTLHRNIIDLSKEWSDKFDKILVDPPCTALGLRPRLHLDVSVSNIRAAADYQKAILFAANKLLKTRGELIYSTCTVSKEENEDVIRFAIDKLGMRVVEQEYSFALHSAIANDFSHPVQRFIPGNDLTIGFFIAKLQKVN